MLDGFEPNHAALRLMGMWNELNFRWVNPIKMPSRKYLNYRRTIPRLPFRNVGMASVHAGTKNEATDGSPFTGATGDRSLLATGGGSSHIQPKSSVKDCSGHYPAENQLSGLLDPRSWMVSKRWATYRVLYKRTTGRRDQRAVRKACMSFRTRSLLEMKT
jgi:hypothetical protein